MSFARWMFFLVLFILFFCTSLVHAQEVEKKYWFKFGAEWKVNADGDAVAVIVRGTSNLPKQTEIKVWVSGGKGFRFPLPDGRGQVDRIKRIDDIRIRAPRRGHLAGGVLFPELVPDNASGFVIETSPIEAGEVVPGEYEIQVVVDFRQRPAVQVLIQDQVQDREIEQIIHWGAPETLEEYTAKVNKRFEKDLHVLNELYNAIYDEYKKYRADAVTDFDMSAFLDAQENKMIALVERSKEIRSSNVCPRTYQYRNVISGFTEKRLLRVIVGIRRELEASNNSVTLDLPELARPQVLLDGIAIDFKSIYDEFKLLKPGTGDTLPDLMHAIAFCENIGAALAAFKAAGDQQGFENCLRSGMEEMLELFPRLAANVPAGTPAVELLAVSRDLFDSMDAVHYDTFDEGGPELQSIGNCAKDLLGIKQKVEAAMNR